MSDRIEIECPLCGKHSSVPASFAGKLGKCPGCLGTIRVPEDEPAAIGTRVADRVELLDDVAVAIQKSAAPNETPGMKTCQYCGESIREKAKKCRYCGEFFEKTLMHERRAAREGVRPPWAFPTVVMVLLPVQALITIVTAGIVIVARTDYPSLTLWGTSVVFSLIWLVVTAMPVTRGNRSRLLSVVLAAGVHLILTFAVAAGLDLPGEPASPLFGGLHMLLGLFFAFVFYRALKATRAES